MIKNLLDAAKAMTGSDYQTAKKIGVPNTRVSNWRHGKTTMPVADITLVAMTAGLDPVEWCSRAVVAEYEGTEKGAALSEALKKAWLLTGEASTTVTESETFHKLKLAYIRCILC